MASHFLLMVLFSGLVSLVFGVLARDEPVEQARFGGLLFAGFVIAALALGWLMYPFPL